MAIVVVCPKCRNAMHAPEALAGQVRNCLQCRSPVAIPAGSPAPVVAASPQPELVLQAIRAEQWFVTLPNGQVIGPASLEQYQAAVQRAAIPPQAMVQRADWPRAMSQGEIQARQQPSAPAAYAQPQENPTPQGSYWQQLARNPLGTTLFGANVPDFVRGYRPPEVLAERARIFRWCWLIPLAILAAGIVLPLVASIPAAFRFGPHVLVIAPVMMGYAFAWIFWAPIIYLVGTYLFAGALFEWEILFNTKQVRNSRAAGRSIEAIRKFYMWFGGIAMGIGGAPAVLAVLGVTCYCLLAAVVPPPADRPLASNAPRPAAAPGMQPARPLPPPAGLAVTPSSKPVTSPANPNVTASPNATVETMDGVTTIRSSGPTSIRSPGSAPSEREADMRARMAALDLAGKVSLQNQLLRDLEPLKERLKDVKDKFIAVRFELVKAEANPNELSRRITLNGLNQTLFNSCSNYQQYLRQWNTSYEALKSNFQGKRDDLSPPDDLPREIGDYIAQAKNFPVDEVQVLESQFLSGLTNYQQFLSWLKFGDGRRSVQVFTGHPSKAQFGPVDEMIEVQLNELKRIQSKLREYQQEWNYASKHLEQKPSLEQQLAEARQAKQQPAFAGPSGSVAPPGSGTPNLQPAPNPNATTLSRANLQPREKILQMRIREYKRQKEIVERGKLHVRLPEVQKDPTIAAIMEAQLKPLIEMLENSRKKMLEARSELEALCREIGETSKLLDEPLPE